jgi:4-amino-4-deoxy-L-arabinose transferase-like glycosyltransferase
LTWADRFLFILLAALASACGGSVARRFPWSARARDAGVPWAFGVALAPFLAGLGAVLALGLLRGFGAQAHLGFVTVLLAAGALSAVWRRRPADAPAGAGPSGIFPKAILFLIGAFVVVLIAETQGVPLIQHDSLEYAAVGRILFETRDLSAYPALAANPDGSGFYGPWTHPPLYPALIHLAYCLQGRADVPGLMRLVAPWCFLAGLVLTGSLGRLLSRGAGALAALLYASTPLLFLGASSGLIDPVPVLGMTLVLASLLAFEGAPRAVGLAQGLALGLALWSHSQALLFPFLYAAGLVVRLGWKDRRRLAVQAATAAAAAIVLAAWPYGRNLAIYGSLISDTPEVFALPELGFAEYFRLNRALDHPSDLVQYGLLKGWFAHEAYAGLFWLMIPGAVLLVRRIGLGEALRGLPSGEGERGLRVPLGILLAYHAGMLLSIVLGIDLMIRNERYLLVLTPCAALLAAWGLDVLLSRDGRPGWKLAGQAGVILLFLAQLLVVGGHRWRSLGGGESTMEGRLRRWAPYPAIEYINREVPREALVLALKVSDFYYSDRRMLSYLHPRMVPVYGEKDAARALARLRELGVTHVYSADYSLPPAYHPAIQEILGRPDLSSLRHSSGGHQVYELVADPRSLAREVPLGGKPWMREAQLVLGGRKNLVRIPLSSRPLEPGERSSGGPFPLFLREASTVLRSPRIEVPESSPGAEWRFTLVLEGDAFAQVGQVQGTAEGKVLEASGIGDLPLSPEAGPRTFTRRYRIDPRARWVELRVEHRGRSAVAVRSARAEVLESRP